MESLEMHTALKILHWKKASVNILLLDTVNFNAGNKVYYIINSQSIRGVQHTHTHTHIHSLPSWCRETEFHKTKKKMDKCVIVKRDISTYLFTLLHPGDLDLII